jgi:hypothetical protein|tara:strand:+ start:475 stop:579 length:105 start_codon:yes stop_codon:yes gene_type:complete
MRIPTKQAIRRLIIASRVIKARPTARRGGIMEVQ